MLTILLYFLYKIGITSIPLLSLGGGPTSPHALQRCVTGCFGSRSPVGDVNSTITRLEIHVVRESRTKPKHDVSRSHRNIVSHVVSLRVPRREPKHECNSDRDVDIDRAWLFDILSDLIFVLRRE